MLRRWTWTLNFFLANTQNIQVFQSIETPHFQLIFASTTTPHLSLPLNQSKWRTTVICFSTLRSEMLRSSKRSSTQVAGGGTESRRKRARRVDKIRQNRLRQLDEIPAPTTTRTEPRNVNEQKMATQADSPRRHEQAMPPREVRRRRRHMP